MKSTVVDESLSSFKPMYCSREYQASTRLIQQYEKSTLKKIKHLSINPEEETLVSFDVSALFTSIPVPIVLPVINSEISLCTSFTNICKIPIVKFIKLLEFMLTNCIFCFNKKFYKQLQGTAIGSPVSLSLQISTWNTLNP